MTATSPSGLARAAEACDQPRSQQLAPRVGKGRPGVVLAALFVVAAAYSALQSRGHVTPAIYMDELMFEKLAQSFAGGHPFEIRGQTEFFPSFLAALLASPAWLVENVATAYAIAKALNAVLMASAVFPVYWLARQLVRPSWSLVAAATAAASPALLYHSYLSSGGARIPGVLSRAGRGGARDRKALAPLGIAVVGISLVAVATRAQLVALPIAYVVAVAVCGRKELRRHAVGVGGRARRIARPRRRGGSARAVSRRRPARLLTGGGRPLDRRPARPPAVGRRPRRGARRGARARLPARTAAHTGGARLRRDRCRRLRGHADRDRGRQCRRRAVRARALRDLPAAAAHDLVSRVRGPGSAPATALRRPRARTRLRRLGRAVLVVGGLPLHVHLADALDVRRSRGVDRPRERGHRLLAPPSRRGSSSRSFRCGVARWPRSASPPPRSCSSPASLRTPAITR